MTAASNPPDTPPAVAGSDSVAIVSFTGDSGIADYSVSLARQLAALVPTTLVTSNRLPSRFEQLGFDVVKIFRRTRWYPVDLVRFVAWCRAHRPRALSFQSELKFPLVDAIAVRLLRRMGMRCVLSVHDVLPHYPRPWSRWLYSRFYRGFDGLVVHSDAARQQIERVAPGVPWLQVPHGVYDLFRLDVPTQATARARLGLPGAGKFCVLFFGHLEPRKGLGVLLAAAEGLRDEPELHFVIAGELNRSRCPSVLLQTFERVRALPNVLVHEGRVPFERVQDYFAAADVVALPYLVGSTSGVLKVALAFGVPVVGTRVGDLDDEAPAQGALLVDTGPGLEARFAAALLEGRQRHEAMRQGMRAAAGAAAWHGIAAAYHRFLIMAPATRAVAAAPRVG